MSVVPVPSNADRDQLLADLLTDLSDQARQGREPDIDAAAARHPDLARELRELWAAGRVARRVPRGTCRACGRPCRDHAAPLRRL